MLACCHGAKRLRTPAVCRVGPVAVAVAVAQQRQRRRKEGQASVAGTAAVQAQQGVVVQQACQLVPQGYLLYQALKQAVVCSHLQCHSLCCLSSCQAAAATAALAIVSRGSSAICAASRGSCSRCLSKGGADQLHCHSWLLGKALKHKAERRPAVWRRRSGSGTVKRARFRRQPQLRRCNSSTSLLPTTQPLTLPWCPTWPAVGRRGRPAQP